jgi:hypothetical protein
MSADTSSGRHLGVLLVCFDGRKTAAKARRAFETRLRSGGNIVFDTTVLKVDDKHKVSVYDPHRVLLGTLTPLLTWGVFGLLTGGVVSMVASALLGAAFGGLAAYHLGHHATKAQLVRLGRQLPAPSSLLLTFAETSDPRSLLDIATQRGRVVASAATIAADLRTRVFTGSPADPVEITSRPADGSAPPTEAVRMSMVLLRYPDAATARQIASRIMASEKTAHALEVELVAETNRSGHRHVTDPKFGPAAIGRSNVVSWGGFGLVCGAIGGAVGGGGLLGVFGGGLLTGVAWGFFGLGAGALYGLWAGRAVSARRLKGIGPLLAPGSSTLLAWTDRPLSRDAIDLLTTPGSERLVLRVNPVEGGAVLDARSSEWVVNTGSVV